MEQSNCQIHGVSFRLFNENEAKKLSSLAITNPTTFDPLGHPIDNGLGDTALGPLKRNDFCKTCGLTDDHCMGHYGHITLPLPVFNPFLMKQMFQILQMFCFKCHHLLFTRYNLEVYIAQLRALNLGLDYILNDIAEFANEITNGNKGFDWSSLEGQTYLRGKLNEKINSEFKHVGTSPPDTDAESQTESKSAGGSRKKTKDSLINPPNLAQLESVEIQNSKNVIEKRQQMFKDFIGGKLLKPSKVCHHCNSRKVAMNLVKRSEIILNAAKAAQNVRQFTAEDESEVTTGNNNNQSSSSADINIEMKGNSYLTPSQAREHFRRLWGNEKETLLRLFPFINLDIEDEVSVSAAAAESSCSLDVFFWETIIISPNRYRPLRFLNGRSFEHNRTSALSELLLIAKSLEYALENAKKDNSGESIARFHAQWRRLQIVCNRLYDAKMDNLPDNKAIGVKQILEKKEGLLRKNMMGKRVNFAARSVISPDPYIMADEIGIPLIFATKLSYPQPVTNWNVKQLQQMVINGPDVHPGALSISYDNGFLVRLKSDDIAQRRSIAATLHAPSLSHGMKGVPVVNRHLISGDVLLLNRQPSLHKPSIMAHKARVLPKEKTLRLHYANCKCYNADFDGDEMNAHFPQSELARSEAYNIASVNYQFLIPKDGSPLSGLIQDHIIAGVVITVRGRFFNKQDYQALVYGALSFLNRPIRTLPPTILKPKRLWSGKQIISTLIINLVPANKPLPSLQIECKISPKLLTNSKVREWKAGGTPFRAPNEMCENLVIFHKGELLSGIMDKVNFGANKNGLIHVCYELYGGDVHTRLLTAFARLSTNFLQCFHGFTLGIHDVLVRARPNEKRRKLIESSHSLGHQAVNDAFHLMAEDCMAIPPEVIRDKLSFAHTASNDFYMKQLDTAYKSVTDSLSNEISAACIPKGLVKLFPENHLQMMIQAGAKGGSVNAIQISCLLGQIELEGRRIPLMMSGRTLPSFRPYETRPRAGGFVTGRFLTGIRPQEFFFHCMAGREGLIDTAVKTSRSGYLQRCLIKHLEGLVVNYDLTVRDSEGSVVQWLYGEDGLDVIKSQSLNKSFFPTIVANPDALKPTKDELRRLKSIRDTTLTKQVNTLKKLNKFMVEPSKLLLDNRESPFLLFENDYRANNVLDDNYHFKSIITREVPETETDQPLISSVGNVSTHEVESEALIIHLRHRNQITDAWYDLDPKQRLSYGQMMAKRPDPIIARFRPDLNLGAISETLDSMIHSYIEGNLKSGHNKQPQQQLTVKQFKDTMKVNYMRSLCAPGEAVGLLAAQSIGEPSTQMTLNTFHFAGRGEMNVTLGVPRLREILMTASHNISTPSMDIPFRTDIEPEVLEIEAEKVRRKLNAVRLKDVLEDIEISERLEISQSEFHHRHRIYRIKFCFLPRKFYKQKYFTSPAKILHYIESSFMKQLIEAMNRKIRLLTKSNGLFDTKSIRRSTIEGTGKKGRNVDGDVDEEELMMQNGSAQDNEDQKGPGEPADDDDEEDDDDDFDDDDVDAGEGDATAMRHRSRMNQEQEYEEPDQDEMDHSDNEYDEFIGDFVSAADLDDSAISNIKQELLDQELHRIILDASTVLSSKKRDKTVADPDELARMEKEAQERCERVKNVGAGTVLYYKFDTERQLWCEIELKFDLMSTKLDLRSLIEEEVSRFYVYRVGKIDRAFLVKDNQAAKLGAPFCQLIKTEGVSLSAVMEFAQFLDLRRIYTNDMHAIARTYGIEAARAALIREITNVFSVYGISVDGRHLSLIADHMTFTGQIKGMNRGAMDGISPLQSMTFETTTNFLKNALLLNLNDDLQSPSSRLVIGRPTLVGTGLFETRLNPMLVSGLKTPNETFGTNVLHRNRIGGGSSLSSMLFSPSTSFSSSRNSSIGSFLSPSLLLGSSKKKSSLKRPLSKITKEEPIEDDDGQPTTNHNQTTNNNKSTNKTNKNGILSDQSNQESKQINSITSIESKRIKIEFDD